MGIKNSLVQQEIVALVNRLVTRSPRGLLESFALWEIILVGKQLRQSGHMKQWMLSEWESTNNRQLIPYPQLYLPTQRPLSVVSADVLRILKHV